MGLLSWLFRGDDKEELVKVGAGARQMQPASMRMSGMQAENGTQMQHPGSMSEMTTTKDPVCGMDVNPKKAAATSAFDGTTYYFCAPRCKKAFDANPTMYLGGSEKMTEGTHGSKHGGGCCC